MRRILLAVAFAGLAVPAHAALATFQSFTGNVAMSTDGFGGNDGAGVISASAPTGSTVQAAYLYSSTFFSDQNTAPTAVTLNATAVSYDVSHPNTTACCTLSSHRADVTSIVKPVIDAGGGPVFNFNISEGTDNSSLDGHALVVVYSNPALPNASVGILDGFADVTGDMTSINFANPLDPTEPGFVAEMILGIGFSCCDQKSRVEVNDMLLTQNAGNNDDSEDAFEANGNLITVGSFDDPLSPANPTYAQDSERYDLTPFVMVGDTSIKVETFNASEDDNLFLAAFYVSGEAGFNAPPPTPTNPIPVPASLLMLLTGVFGLGAAGWRRSAA